MTACGRATPGRCASTSTRRSIIRPSSARFLENHDEPRAAATFEPPVHRAAAVITYSVPGLRFFHQGQFEGRTKRISPHLVRAPEEVPDKEIKKFYDRLLAVLRKPVMKGGEWQSAGLRARLGRERDLGLVRRPLLAGGRRRADARRRELFAPRTANAISSCLSRRSRDRSVRLKDLLGDACYDRDGTELAGRGLYLDMPAWSYHVFHIEETP